MGTTSWRGQIDRALSAIDHLGESKYQAKQEQGWQPGEAVAGLFSHGYRNTVFDRAVTFTHWLREQYPAVRLFREVDYEMTAEFLGENAETCTPDTVRTLLATLKKLEEGLYAMNWIREDIMPAEWQVSGRNPPRGPMRWTKRGLSSAGLKHETVNMVRHCASSCRAARALTKRCTCAPTKYSLMRNVSS